MEEKEKVKYGEFSFSTKFSLIFHFNNAMLKMPSKLNEHFFERPHFYFGKNAGFDLCGFFEKCISLLGGKSSAFFGARLLSRTFLFEVKRYAKSDNV